MKRSAFLASTLFLLLLAVTGFAQSRRPVPTDAPPKANKRDPQAAATPKPAPTPADENTTNIETVPPAGDPFGNDATDDKDVIRVDTELVTVPVKVTDRSGRYAAGLTKENFKLFEDGKEQDIAYFSNVEEPFTVALILDMSYSSTFKISEIQQAATAFISQLHPKDRVMIVSFDEEIHVLSEPTSDRKALQTAVRGAQIASGTSLYEAVDFVLNKRFNKISGRKAVVLFTDGVDTTSRRVGGNNNLSDAFELDALIYPIEYDTYADVQAMKNKPVSTGRTGLPTIPDMPSNNKSPLPFPLPSVGTPSGQGTDAQDYQRAHEYLDELATRTSGRVYQASTIANLAAAFSNIAAELRQLYSLGFYPTEQKEGKPRKLKVKVDQKGLAVQSRESYVVRKKDKGKK